MGYTHYWVQRRDLTQREFNEISSDIADILKEVQHNQGIPLANGAGDPGTSPEFTATKVWFNGVGDDAHETMCFNRKRYRPSYEGGTIGAEFCKTAEKPYDLAVTAVLAYLATCTRTSDPKTGEPVIGSELYQVTSDGSGTNWLSGVDLVRKALPKFGNQIDIPMAIMQRDRWCGPYVSLRGPAPNKFDVHFCIDGKGYVFKVKTGESYCFNTHLALAEFLEKNKHKVFENGRTRSWGSYSHVEEDIWRATGSFDKDRHARIGRAREKVLSKLFPADNAHASPPPAYVRPGQMPDNAGREFCYSIADLLNLAGVSQ